MTTTVVTAYVLHTRPYRESAVLCELFSREQGRLSAIAHGARGARRRNAMPAFVALQVELAGRREPQTVRRVETLDARWLEGEGLAAGIYLNELLLRVLPAHDAHEPLFDAYAEVVAMLPTAGGELAPTLRRFERALLAELGYALRCDCDADGISIDRTGCYRWEPGNGFVADPDGDYPGATLERIECDDFTEPTTRRLARRLFSAALAAVLDGRPLRSRMLLARPDRTIAAAGENAVDRDG